MHKYKILFFLVLIFCAGCNSGEVPKGVLDEETMTSVLTQIHIADGSMYNVMQVPDTLYKYGLNKYVMVLKSFHTDTTQFKKSMKYYTQHPDILLKMYDKISVDLKAKSDSLNKVSQARQKDDEKRRMDSIKKLPKQLQNNVAPAAQQTAPIAQPAPVSAKQPPAHFTNKRYLPGAQPSKPKNNASPAE
jgi:hypothetical protein